MRSTSRSEDRGFLESWAALLRRRWISGAIAFVIVFGLAATMVLLAHPIYRAEARLRLSDPPPQAGLSAAGGLLGLGRLGSDAFANDLELIASRTVAERLVEDASLNARVQAPRGWHRDSLFVRFATTRATDKGSFAVEWLESGRVRVVRTAPQEAVIGEVTPGLPLSFGGVTAAFRPWRAGAPREISITTIPFGEAVRSARSAIRSERARREANVIDLTFDNIDPAIAKAAVTSVLTRFVELRTALQRRESGQTADSLRVVANQTLGELTTAEAAIGDLEEKTGLFAPEAQSEAFVERYNDAIGELEKVRAELEAVNSVLRRADQVVNPTEAWTTLLAYPRFLENATVGEMLSRLTELEAQRAEVAPRRTTENREFQVLNEQIAYLDRTLRSLAINYRTALSEQVRELEKRVGALDAVLARVPQQVIELGRRRRTARILSEVVVLTEQRLRQEELRQALTFSNVQVIDPPELRFKPVWPRKKLGLGVGFLLAGMTAILAMLVVERADTSQRRVRSIPVPPSIRHRDLAGRLE
jgi:uncharacterized protein involved in exopolysaccharide biosynthesis